MIKRYIFILKKSLRITQKMEKGKEKKKSWYSGVLALYSGLFLLHITTTYMQDGQSFPIILFKATGITSLLIMWLYGLDNLK